MPLRFALWFGATLISLNICAVTGLVTDWGKWYSPSLQYRRQTDAFLTGHFALSQSPNALENDFAWGEKGVQQVWGLGVPFWRLPFELLSRLFGQQEFPDRFALAAAILVVGYIVLRIFTAPPWVRSLGEWSTSVASNPTKIAVVLLLLAFPPVITLCRCPFNVYVA